MMALAINWVKFVPSLIDHWLKKQQNQFAA